MGTEVLTVSQSEVNTFRTCRWKWSARYMEGLRPKRDAEPLIRGKVVHAGIAAAYEVGRGGLAHLEAAHVKLMAAESATREALRTVNAAHVAELDDEAAQQVHDWLGIIERFVDAFVIPDLERYEVVSVEHPFGLRLRNARGTRQPYLNMGAIDVILRDPENGSLIVSEHKTTAGDCHTMDARLDVDPQTPGYVWALGEEAYLYGAERSAVGRVFLSCIRTKGESEPKINKIQRSDTCWGNGCEDLPRGKHAEACGSHYKRLKDAEDLHGRAQGLISSAPIDCTWDRYHQALVDQYRLRGLAETAKQNERLQQLPTTTDRWAARHGWYYHQPEIDRWAHEHLADARLIRQARAGRLPITRNGAACFPQNAASCPYRAVCVQDAPEIREELYEVDHTRGGRP